MLEKTIVNQAMELYRLGIKLESKRKKLADIVSKYGTDSDQAINVYFEVKVLMEKFDKLERKHLNETQKIINMKEAI